MARLQAGVTARGELGPHRTCVAPAPAGGLELGGQAVTKLGIVVSVRRYAVASLADCDAGPG
ncbi:hypothetical protein [Rugosimonospora africana]|uniref:hypothetical protein n=1 Tax=Rugosimonospora africana TaxID=556532 RepID=UPI0019414CDC|nr:hypothetical protein [Rugosimonospora africana]